MDALCDDGQNLCQVLAIIVCFAVAAFVHGDGNQSRSAAAQNVSIGIIADYISFGGRSGSFLRVCKELSSRLFISNMRGYDITGEIGR